MCPDRGAGSQPRGTGGGAGSVGGGCLNSTHCTFPASVDERGKALQLACMVSRGQITAMISALLLEKYMIVAVIHKSRCPLMGQGLSLGRNVNLCRQP